MDASRLTCALVADLDPAARPVVAGYLRELAAALPVSRHVGAPILTEIADGLIGQITDTTGPDPAAVARAAIRSFGSPRHLAAQFARELTGKTAHRTGFALVCSGPLIGATWLLALTSGQSTAIAGSLPRRIGEMFTALPVLPALLLVIIPCALIAIAGAGRASRVVPITTATAGLAGLIAGAGCVLVDSTLIGQVLMPGGIGSPLLAMATTLSSARLILAAAAARRCAKLRSAG